MPIGHTLETDPIDVAVRAVAGVRHRITEGDQGQDTPTGGGISPRTGGRPGVEGKDVALDGTQAIDREAALIGPWISAGGEDDADARPVGPGWFDLGERAPPSRAPSDGRHQAGSHISRTCRDDVLRR